MNTLKRDYVNVTPLPDAATVLGSIAGWFEDDNENHPHSGLSALRHASSSQLKSQPPECPVKRGQDHVFAARELLIKNHGCFP